MRSSSSCRPTSGSSRPSAAASVRSRENSESRGVSLALGPGAPLVPHGRHILADGGNAHPPLAQHSGGSRVLLAQKAEEDVLGADVVVEHPLRLLRGESEDALRIGREGDVHRGRDLLPVGRGILDLLANFLGGKLVLAEEAGGEPLALPDQAEQEVLGLDGGAPQLAGLVASEEDHAPRSFSVALEHTSLLPRSWRAVTPAPSLSPIIAQTGLGPSPGGG